MVILQFQPVMTKSTYSAITAYFMKTFCTEFCIWSISCVYNY